MYKKLLLLTCVLAFVAVVFSAYARLSDAGFGCTDWPACYKENALKERQPPQADAARDHTSWRWKVQNMVGLLLGILGIALCGLAWQQRKELRQSPVLPTLLVGMMAFMAVFGIWAFSHLPRSVIVPVHLAGGSATLIVLTWLVLRQMTPVKMSADVMKSWRGFSLLGLALVLSQIMLGGWVSANFAGLACTGFPLCKGALLPPMDFSFDLERYGLPLSEEKLTAIHLIHRVGALLTILYLSWLSFRIIAVEGLHKIGKAILGLLVFQLVLGIANVLLGLPLAGAVLHNAVAMLLLMTLVLLSYRLRKQKI